MPESTPPEESPATPRSDVASSPPLSPPQPPADPPPLSFDALALGRPEIQIEYRGQLYRLRATRNGKLILNK